MTQLKKGQCKPPCLYWWNLGSKINLFPHPGLPADWLDLLLPVNPCLLSNLLGHNAGLWHFYASPSHICSLSLRRCFSLWHISGDHSRRRTKRGRRGWHVIFTLTVPHFSSTLVSYTHQAYFTVCFRILNVEKLDCTEAGEEGGCVHAVTARSRFASHYTCLGSSSVGHSLSFSTRLTSPSFINILSCIGVRGLRRNMPWILWSILFGDH